MNFQIGDWVKWISQAQGTFKTKVGEIVAVIPAGVSPLSAWLTLDPAIYGYSGSTTLPRNHESYLVALPKRPKGTKRFVYWPLVKNLRKVNPPKKESACQDG